MIKKCYVVNDEESFKVLLNELKLKFKDCWKNYIWLNKTDYYRLVIFDNGEYGLFTQSQLPIIKSHEELNSANWADYKPYADKGYPVMRPNGVKAGTKDDSSWTPMRKEVFRKRRDWTEFKEKIYYWNTCSNNMIICEDCKKFFAQEDIDVHHIAPNEYDNLERKKFMLLCRSCHSIRTKRGE